MTNSLSSVRTLQGKTLSRLSALCSATRMLRGMGYRIQSEDLCLEGNRSRVVIRCDSSTDLDALFRQTNLHGEASDRTSYVLLHGVNVSWSKT